MLKTMTENEILEQLFSLDWAPEQLVEFANKRHGYASDGYTGITYPSDLDEYQKEVEGEFIPDGFIEIMYWDGAEKELLIREESYLAALKMHLMGIGHKSLASEIDGA